RTWGGAQAAIDATGSPTSGGNAASHLRASVARPMARRKGRSRGTDANGGRTGTSRFLGQGAETREAVENHLNTSRFPWPPANPEASHRGQFAASRSEPLS